VSLEEVSKLVEFTKKHNTWRKNCINLIASENVTSPLVDLVYLSDFMHRYAEGMPFKRFYQGTRYVDEVETYAASIMGELFNVKYVDLRPISGTTANGAVFYALAPEGGESCIVKLSGGGHVSHSQYGIMGALKITPHELPFDVETMNIDVDGAVKMIKEVKPKFVVLGASLYLFPHPDKEIKEACEEVGAVLVHDVAHVLGLIAGKVFPNPLERGADILTSSTHKTFPGPQGGVIMTNNEKLYKKIKKVVFPVFVSNHHLHRLAATGIAALEMKYFGEEYAKQVVRNAKRLAEKLYEYGFKVLGEKVGFTQTHQVAVDVTEFGGGAPVAETLEKANIILNKNMLPYDTPDKIKNPSGIRIGVQEMTRVGMKESEMDVIAEFFKKILIDKKNPVEVKKEVIEFRKQYQEIHYTFDLTKLGLTPHIYLYE